MRGFHIGDCLDLLGQLPDNSIHCLVPFRVALALQADGWWLRSNIVWAKPNPMPESCKDRPTSSHESLFLLTKSARYAYDAEAIKERSVSESDSGNGYARAEMVSRDGRGQADGWTVAASGGTRNKRNVWTIATRPYKGSHYAVMRPALVEPCIKAGCPVGGVVLDPFMGAGTVAMVAEDLGRGWLGFDLDARNFDLARLRTAAKDIEDALGRPEPGALPGQRGLFG